MDMDNSSKTEDVFIPEQGIPYKLSLLRWNLNRKAKREPNFRFYSLYDKIWRWDTLETAWKQVKANKGSAGIDGVSIKDIERNGIEEFLKELQESLSNKTYRPQMVKRVYIPKSDGGKRPLGIPTVLDRVAQMIAKLVLEPVLEPMFHEDSYAYRPEKSALQALAKTRGRCWKYDWVIDLDIKGFFDTIDHSMMLKAVDHIHPPKWVRLYIERWLKAPVQEVTGSKGDNTMGTPQGGVISPLLKFISAPSQRT